MTQSGEEAFTCVKKVDLKTGALMSLEITTPSCPQNSGQPEQRFT